MAIGPTISSGRSRLNPRAYGLPVPPPGLIIVLLILAVIALWMGVSSATRTSPPVEHTPPSVLVHTAPHSDTPTRLT